MGAAVNSMLLKLGVRGVAILFIRPTRMVSGKLRLPQRKAALIDDI